MSIFAIGDLHLSLGTDKPMDIFRGWEDYESRLLENWTKNVTADDTVVLCGDISWAMKLEETVKDFSFIESLPGKKLIIKGNHDYWWSTRSKLERFFEQNGFSSVGIIHNSCYEAEDICLCGTRGWGIDAGEHDEKIIMREAMRLRESLLQASKTGKEAYVFLHYPPLYGTYICAEILDVLIEFKVKHCFYGHLHAAAHKRAVTGVREGIDFRLVSSDYLGFKPELVKK